MAKTATKEGVQIYTIDPKDTRYNFKDSVKADILDKELIKENLQDADVVHHLAGITDVARTSKEINSNKDKKLNLVAIEGTKNVINAMPEKAKIIFPSTHVVYEGVEKVKKDIKIN